MDKKLIAYFSAHELISADGKSVVQGIDFIDPDKINNRRKYESGLQTTRSGKLMNQYQEFKL